MNELAMSSELEVDKIFEIKCDNTSQNNNK